MFPLNDAVSHHSTGILADPSSLSEYNKANIRSAVSLRYSSTYAMDRDNDNDLEYRKSVGMVRTVGKGGRRGGADAGMSVERRRCGQASTLVRGCGPNTLT